MRLRLPDAEPLGSGNGGLIAMDDKLMAALIGGGISLVVTAAGLIFNPITQRQLQAFKQRQDAELSALKSRLDDALAERKAQRDYEYEARKRLYTQVEPLMLQLGFAAENAFGRAANLALVARKGFLDPGPRSWLDPGDEGRRYYLNSTLYRLLLPLAFFELLRGKTTQLDFKLEPRLEAIFRLMRQQYRSWGEEFAFAAASPVLAYEPYAPEAVLAQVAQPQLYRRQGLALGRVDKIAAAMVVADGSAARVRRFGEFETDWATGTGELADAAGPFYALFAGFRPDLAPVTWRLICAQACLVYAVRRLVGPPRDDRDIIAIVESFCRDPRTRRRFAISADPATGEAAAARNFSAIESVLVRALRERDLLD